MVREEHLREEEVGVVVSVAFLLVRLTQVEHHKRSVVPRRQETRHVPDVVAVRRVLDARQRERDEAVGDVGQVEVELRVAVEEAPLGVGHSVLQHPTHVPGHPQAQVHCQQPPPALQDLSPCAGGKQDT
eukprot:2341828-Rhodomonas_salina.1